MAFSRLYLGVHYASDVVAGLLAGVAWVAICVSALEVLRRGIGGARHV
jgi:undecaprenyl-diphosphatase